MPDRLSSLDKRLLQPIMSIKGIGPKIGEQFSLSGLESWRDLIYFLPRKHQDFSKVVAVSDIKPGLVSVRGKISNIATKRASRNLSITEATLSDDTGGVRLVWFGQSYRAEQLKKDKEWLVAGEFGLTGKRYQITNPSVEDAHNQSIQGARLLPIYPTIKGLKSNLVRKTIFELKALINMLPENLPEEIIKKFRLISHSEALTYMHFPDNNDQVELARERLGFEEVYGLILAAQLNKQVHSSLPAHKIKFDLSEAENFLSQLSFKLTDDQRISCWEIIKNFESHRPMNRLLQGDVGAGKTVVAGMAAYLASKQGFQTALLAPTELLATQHAETLNRILSPLDIKLALLTGSVNRKSKNILYDQIKSGSVDIVVGTHAIFQKSVEFSRLGFVVIDEQHRFGVAQRQKLLEKGEKMPHLLSMTATPIPRSLQLTVYGELEISLLRQKPRGRKNIITKICSPNSRNSIYQEIDEQIELGRQAYVVCPLISDSHATSKYEAQNEAVELRSVEGELMRLKKSQLRSRSLAILHGKMSSEDKDEIMNKFKHGEIDVVVSTTVIEVGVDVPNATVMLIEGADKFGLAQLHQLRGRVGRSEHQSYCYLVPSTSARPSRRLRELEKSNDGFYLAEKDLELRGPGAIYGYAQHGTLNLNIANLADTQLLKKAQDAARYTIENNLDLSNYPKLLAEINKYQRLTTLN
jgi:ATP-dependent DNA helicase RecG